jgi:molybdopterin-guanine dinucleotide biosynthesis protein MobB
MPVIVSFVGRSESGKTTLIEKLIPVLRRRGFRVGTIKHTHHSPELDRSGKDSARHLAAGASTVVLASSGQIQLVKTGVNGGLAGLVRYFDDVDLLITEGYKQERTPKHGRPHAPGGGDRRGSRPAGARPAPRRPGGGGRLHREPRDQKACGPCPEVTPGLPA